MKLSERAVLTTLTIGVWTGTVTDKAVTEQANAAHQAERDAGKYAKKLIAPKFLRPVNTAAQQARQTHNMLTLPWFDSGTRILATRGYEKYTDQLRAARLRYETATDNFITGYNDFITEAHTRLGSMFNRDEYPEAETLREKFHFGVEIHGVPESGDFRAKLPDPTTKALVKEIERKQKQRLDNAMTDIYRRMEGLLTHLVKKLREYQPSRENGEAVNLFRDSLIYNIASLAEIIPAMNLTDNAELNKLAQRMKDELTEHDPCILRTDSNLRKQTVDKAEQLLKQVGAFLA